MMTKLMLAGAAALALSAGAAFAAPGQASVLNGAVPNQYAEPAQHYAYVPSNGGTQVYAAPQDSVANTYASRTQRGGEFFTTTPPTSGGNG